MRKFLIPLVCFCTLFAARPAQAGWRDYVSPSKNWQRIKNCCSATSAKITGYCSDKLEKAKAEQAKMWGLKLPANLDPDRPLVVLIHGLDSSSGVWDAMDKLLLEQNLQVAHFSYPSDGPISGDADRLAAEMTALHAAFPTLRVHILAHSMGSLVARSFIEGDRYTNNVEHFIALAPPNHGSPWTRQRWLLEAHEQYWLWRCNKEWSPIWMFTDGHGEAADDLKPDSSFLKVLNERPRREGVKYTIIVGDHHILSRMGSNAIASVENCLPRSVWGLRQCRSGLEKAAASLASQQGGSDGVVLLDSAQLDGVGDVVRLHADHNTLAMSVGGATPASWETIRQRLLQ